MKQTVILPGGPLRRMTASRQASGIALEPLRPVVGYAVALQRERVSRFDPWLLEYPDLAVNSAPLPRTQMGLMCAEVSTQPRLPLVVC
jgi:hypothetical protein